MPRIRKKKSLKKMMMVNSKGAPTRNSTRCDRRRQASERRAAQTAMHRKVVYNLKMKAKRVTRKKSKKTKKVRTMWILMKTKMRKATITSEYTAAAR